MLEAYPLIGHTKMLIQVPSLSQLETKLSRKNTLAFFLSHRQLLDTKPFLRESVLTGREERLYYLSLKLCRMSRLAWSFSLAKNEEPGAILITSHF
jgi:hypothetical protein